MPPHSLSEQEHSCDRHYHCHHLTGQLGQEYWHGLHGNGVGQQQCDQQQVVPPNQVKDTPGIVLGGGGCEWGRVWGEGGRGTCSCGLPPLLRTSKLSMSRERSPMVSPDIRPGGREAS